LWSLHLCTTESITWIEVDALLDNGLVVVVQRMPLASKKRGPFMPRLDLKSVVAAVTVLVEPFADRPMSLGKRDNDFHRRIAGQSSPWHAGRQAGEGWVGTLPALCLISEVRL
jgi:hypothetical protein